MKGKLRNEILRQQRKKVMFDKEWYSVRSIFGHTWAFFYLLIGAREAGKSYSVMKEFLKDWKSKGKQFTWIRLKESAQKKLLQNSADKLVDADLRRKFNLKLTVKGDQVFDDGKPMCKVLCLSTFYNDKGTALYDNENDLGYNIMLDEANLELGERRQGDIAYQFVNQMENLVRSSKEKIRIVIVMNDTDSCGDILALFNFVPEEWGRYKIRKKKAVMDYIPQTEKYIKRREGSVANLLMPQRATFSNKREIDKTRIYKGRLRSPTAIIIFDKETKYTVWDSKVIKSYCNEKCNNIVAMRPYIGYVFNPEQRQAVLDMYDARYFLYRDLITELKFTKALELLKPRK